LSGEEGGVGRAGIKKNSSDFLLAAAAEIDEVWPFSLFFPSENNPAKSQPYLRTIIFTSIQGIDQSLPR
jgi:hypothetical protein